MVAQFDNLVMSSFLLWLDNRILTKGEAFTNYSSQFYKVKDSYSNYYTYGLPFKQVLTDASISNASIMSGIYVNNSFVTTGVSGLVDINYAEGQVYFSSQLSQATRVSGRYAVKDFNIYFTDEPEEKILFENKYGVRQKISKAVTGLAPNVETLPAIFLKNNGSSNEGFSFGGTDATKIFIRAIVLADSQFALDAVCGILRDSNLMCVPFIEESNMPFNVLGGYKNGVMNYNNIIANRGALYINRVEVSRYNSRSIVMTEMTEVNPGIYPALVDFEIEAIRNPRA